MTDTIGYVAGVLNMLTFLPQVVKTHRTKRAGDISSATLSMLLVANVLYVTYGILPDLYPVIIMLGIMSTVVVLQIGLTLKYRRA